MAPIPILARRWILYFLPTLRLVEVGLVSLALFSPTASSSMEVTVDMWRGHQVVRANGPIQMQDADRLEQALGRVDALPHGAKVILLDSPGGSVLGGLAISAMFDRSETPIHTVVPDFATCASACASLLLISGDYRTVEPGGRVGQHSCASNGVQDHECNEMLATHAVEHGVSHGSVAAFVTYVPPEDILWFSQNDLDCYGILRYPFERESGFEKSEPCITKILAGEYPQAQSAWRVDFLDDGYRAFLRPVYDHFRELEVSLFCDETKPGELFLSMDIHGPTQTIKEAIIEAFIGARPVWLTSAPFYVTDLNGPLTRVTVPLGQDSTLPFLTEADELIFAINLKEPYEPIVVRTRLIQSRTALIFAANNCISG